MAIGQSLEANSSTAVATKPADQVNVLKVPLSSAQRLADKLDLSVLKIKSASQRHGGQYANGAADFEPFRLPTISPFYD
jgi:hypothetical protein